MSCPDVITAAITKCPFLHELSVQHGSSYARNIATQPTKPAATSSPVQRPILEELDMFHTTFKLFHGRNGVVPLAAHRQPEAAAAAPAAASVKEPRAPAMGPPPMARLPFASISMSLGGLPDPGRGWNHRPRQEPSRRRDRFKPTSAQASGSLSASNLPPSGAAASAAAAGGCPLRKWLGPVAPYVFNTHGKLQCPEAIVQARAALARTEPVRALRPKGLPIKLLAVGATSAAVNVPCGAIREHFEKFSFGWFVAVHASIPFVAMLRKAVVMPKLAIAMTVAAAIFGQVLGSRVERVRIARSKLASATAPTLAAKPQGPPAPRAAAAAAPKKLAARPAPSKQTQQQQQQEEGDSKRDTLAALLSLGAFPVAPSLPAPTLFAHILSPLRVA